MSLYTCVTGDGQHGSRPRRWLAASLTLAMLATPAAAQIASRAASEPNSSAEKCFLVSRFVFSYASPNANLPPINELANLAVRLSATPNGLLALQEGLPNESVRLGDAFKEPLRLQSSALRQIDVEIVRHFNGRGIFGVVAAPSEKDIDPQTLDDLRPPGQTVLHLVVRVCKVTRVTATTPADGVAGKPAAEVSWLRRIVADSPVKPAAEGRSQTTDLLRKDLLDDYIALLNRHPGRQVDVAVSPAGDENIGLEYLASQTRQPVVYAQVCNTGPRHTDPWRERFGTIHNQLTGHDDILSLDYTTDCFQSEQAITASYESPIGNNRRLRYRVYGSWAHYSSFDVGIQNERFSGDEEQLGGEAIWNFYQHHDLFLDLIGGTYGWKVTAREDTSGAGGRAVFLAPYVGLRAERATVNNSLWALATVETPFTVGEGSEKELAGLGRGDCDGDWVVLKWNGGTSFFLEPLLAGSRWNDPSQSAPLTRAHEIALLGHGQYADGYRLIPQAQDPVGGIYSVRGYPQAVTAGDTTIVGTAEYRWHIPRSFHIEPHPEKTILFGRPFRFSPQETLGTTDWDLIARTFYDIGRSLETSRQAGETDETLMSWGVGVELQIRQNFSIRCDWAIALRDTALGQVDAGSNRFCILGTFSW